MRYNDRGFSLIEFIMAMAITLVIGMTVFQLFQQNDRTFRDQNQITALQQGVRSAAAQIAEDIRIAGQNLPVYASRLDTSTAEGSQAILNGSTASELRIRAGGDNVLSRATSPLTLTVGSSATVSVASAGAIGTAVNGSTTRFAYLYGKTTNGWTWIRAQIASVDTSANTVTLTPTDTGTSGTTFAQPYTLSLEEGVSYRLNSGALVRGTLFNSTTQTSPVFVDQTIGDNFTSLQFTYYDATGTAITPNTLANRSAVRRIDLQLTGQTAQNISNGTRPTFAVTLRTYPRNLGVR